MPSTLWTDEFLDAQRRIMDPLADETMDKLMAESGSRKAKDFFELLITRIEMPLPELPEAVLPYMAETQLLPKGTDMKKVALAQDFFLDHGPVMLLSLYLKSLPLLYLDRNGVPILVRTGRLTQKEGEGLERFARRIAETGQFLVDVMTRGSLEPGGIGIQAIQKVRMIHASVRKFVSKTDWRIGEWGFPINQEDLALTLMTFSIALIDALPKFGIREKPERIEAYFYTWNAIGQVLGIQEKMIPKTLEEGRLLLKTILDRNAARTDDGILLTRALIEFANQYLPRPFETSAESMIEYLIGEKYAEMLDLAEPKGCFPKMLPWLYKLIYGGGERLEQLIGEDNKFSQKLSGAMVKGMVNLFNSYKGRNFSLPLEMKRKWSGGDFE